VRLAITAGWLAAVAAIFIAKSPGSDAAAPTSVPVPARTSPAAETPIDRKAATASSLPGSDPSVLFADSYFGTGKPHDMTGRVVRPVMLDTYLPVDTSTWTVNEISCSAYALRSAISLASPKTVITFPPACTILLTSGTATFFQISNRHDEVVIRGNADGQTRVVVDVRGPPPAGGWKHVLFQMGTIDTDSVAAWSWDGGYAKGERVVRSRQPIEEVYPGDIVRLSTDAWTNTHHGYRASHLVVCARWADGTTKGSDCAGVTGNNQIKLDRELPFDMTGAPYYFGRITGHEITQVERRGGGVLQTNNIPTHIGLEDLTIEHRYPMAIDAFNSMVEAQGCFECWMSGVKASSWGNSWLDTGAGGQSSTSRFLVFGSDFEGPLWRMRCNAQVISISNTRPAEVTFADNGECRSWCGRFEPGIWFPDDFSEPGLAGKITSCSCSDGNAECDSSDGKVTVQVFDAGTDTPIDGSSFDPLPGGWASQLNAYGIGGVYFSGPVSSAQLVNSSMKNARVGMIQQQGGYETVAFGNYFVTDATHQQSRCLFTHGGPGSGSLWERNDCDMGYVSYAKAAQGHGIGPYHTMLFNRGRERPHKTNVFGDQCPSGGICVERTNQKGYSNDQMNFLGNFLSIIHQGGTNPVGRPLDLCDNDGSSGMGPNCSNPGPQVPFLMYGMAWIRNVVWGETLGEDDFDANPTTFKPDAFEGGAVDARPTSWATTEWPTTLAYDRQIEADPAWREPAWWCRESGPFHNGMGAPSDDRNGGRPNYSKLPAQIRLESGLCTPTGASP